MNKNSLIAIDVGNTNIALGLFTPEGELTHTYRLVTDRWRTADEIQVLWTPFLQHAGADPDFVLSSVVPPATRELVRAVHKYYSKGVYCVIPTELNAMPVKLHRPEELGPDRLVNAVAGRDLYGPPLIIVDLGTATTYEIVSEQGEYIGGAICPGLHISAQALFEKTALLQRVEVVPPPSAIGKSTIECLQVGLFYGLVAQVEGLVERMQKALPHRAKVIATGGYAELLRDQTPSVDIIDPDLTLKGLQILYRLSQEGAIHLRCTNSSST
ncbi:MAG TPA: type III pantothenate kinase, partial [bacterium]|nr:type III pantothenate kinase [bacterium]